MNTTGLFFGLLIVVFMIVLVGWSRRGKSPVTGAGLQRSRLQRMCPHCGLITSRLKPSCLECGKPFTAVVYSISKK